MATTILSKAGKIINSQIMEAEDIARKSNHRPYILVLGMKQYWLLSHYAQKHARIFTRDLRGNQLIHGYPTLLMGVDTIPAFSPDPDTTWQNLAPLLEKELEENNPFG